MDSLLKRIGRRREESAPEVEATPDDSPPTTDGASPTAPVPLPAGLAPDEPAPETRRRGQLRRRLRHLRQLRDPTLRDLGGFVYEIHRSAAAMDAEERDAGTEVLEGKLTRLAELDRERLALERELGDERPVAVVRQPGVRECPRCGDYVATSARFCSACGHDLRGVATEVERPADAPRPAIGAGEPHESTRP